MIEAPQLYATSRGRLDGYEIEFIQAKSRAGCTPQTIAQMLRRPEQDVRRYCIARVSRAAFVPEQAPTPEPDPFADDPVRPPPRLVVGSVSQTPRPPSVRAAKIIASVASLYGMHPSDITGSSKAAAETHARDQAAWRLWKAGYTYAQIGRFMSGRSCGTIRSAVRRHSERVAAWNRVEPMPLRPQISAGAA